MSILLSVPARVVQQALLEYRLRKKEIPETAYLSNFRDYKGWCE